MKRKNVLRSASRKLLRTFFCLNRLTCFLFLLVVLISIKIIRVYQSTRCCWYSSDIIVSLTSTPQRFHHELPLTIHSLLSQTQLPQEIRLRLSPISNLTEFQLKKSLEKIDSSVDLHQRFDRLVKIYYENEDYGPGTKFIPIIREFHRTNDSKLQNQRLIICDDDQYYHHETISTLNFYSEKYPNSIVGLRGWRIRQDLRWGIRGGDLIEMHHVILSLNIAEPYRVGIITANNAYLLRPSFFNSQLYDDFPQAPLAVRLVDDIWLNGHAAKRNISRFVVPSCCSPISVIRHHTLAENLGRNRISRQTANDHALQWFGRYWEKDLWYRLPGWKKPVYRTWLTTINRQAIGIFQWFKLILQFGFVYD